MQFQGEDTLLLWDGEDGEEEEEEDGVRSCCLRKCCGCHRWVWVLLLSLLGAGVAVVLGLFVAWALGALCLSGVSARNCGVASPLQPVRTVTLHNNGTLDLSPFHSKYLTTPVRFYADVGGADQVTFTWMCVRDGVPPFS